MLEDRVVPTTYFQINDLSALSPSVGTAYVAGFINGNQVLQSDGTFAASASSSAPFFAVSSLPSVAGVTTGPTVQLSVATNGNDRLVFAVFPQTASPPDYPLNGYTAYPFNGTPGVSPPGPYDIFEFGLGAQDDLSAVDSFGLNLSFTGDPSFPSVTYGVLPEYSRAAIQAAYTAFTTRDPEGADFQELLYSSPGTSGYPPLIAGQFSAIVSPKDWLAIYPGDALASYWNTTIGDFFKSGNYLSIDVGPQPGSNGLDVIYSGSSDGTNYNFTRNLTSDNIPNFGLTEQIPASQFTSNFIFAQGLPALTDSGQGDLYDVILEAFERGVALDGVFTTAKTSGESNTAWNSTSNWYTNHLNTYNSKPSQYDVYAKFFHYSTINGTDFRTDFAAGNTNAKPIMGLNQAGLNTPGSGWGQAYGFSLDENPFPTPNPSTGMGTVWPSDQNVPSKTPNGVADGTTLTITLGPWLATSPTVTGVSSAQGPTTGGTPVFISGAGFIGATAVNFGGSQLLAGSFTVNAAGTSITLNSPPHAAGTVVVTVTTPGGTSATSVAGDFTYETNYFAVGSGPGVRAKVKVYKAPYTFKRTIFPFGAFKGGVRVATGDVTGDAVEDIIVAQGAGGRTLVRVYDGTTFVLTLQLTAFPQPGAQQRRLGVFVASADINKDGFEDIVVGADAGWLPLVRVYSGQNGALLKQFLAFAKTFRGGVRVAAGDLDGKDGYPEIVVGSGRGSVVRVFDGHTYKLKKAFNPYQTAEPNKLGVYVALGDVQGDGVLDIITGTGPKIAAEVRVFDASTGEFIDQIFRDPRVMGGIPVGVFDTNGDGKDEVLVGRDPGQKSTVDIWQFKTATQKWLPIKGFLPFGSSDSHGDFVG